MRLESGEYPYPYAPSFGVVDVLYFDRETGILRVDDAEESGEAWFELSPAQALELAEALTEWALGRGARS